MDHPTAPETEQLDLKTYFSKLTADEKETFAKRCDSSVGVIRNVMSGFRRCGTGLAVSIGRESGGRVKLWTLRDDWHRHWPQLIGTEGAPPVPEAEAEQKVG